MKKELEFLKQELLQLLDNIERIEIRKKLEKNNTYCSYKTKEVGELKHRMVSIKHRMSSLRKVCSYDLLKK
jgi:hypothetical protein